VALFALLMAVRSVGAESEGKNAPVVRPSENDAISVSKREFDAINSARNPTLQQKGDVPRMTAPEMPSSGAGSGLGPAPKTQGQEKKSTNWLVDAMEKDAAERKRGTRGPAERDVDRSRESEAIPGIGSQLKEGPNARGETDVLDPREAERKAAAEVAANPLNRFLGQWMTPQDYLLLKPGLAKSGLDSAGLRDSSLLPAPSTIAGNLQPGIDATLRPSSNPAAVLAPSTIAKQNPYLEALNVPAAVNPMPVFAAPPPVAMPAPKATISLAPPAPPVIEPAKSKVPDFAKPAQDEKYFKQLKRF
jgi:hypothetical protein